MIKSAENTGFILIKAETNSQWDGCNFAIIEVTESWIDILKVRLDRLSVFKEDISFYNHAYWDSLIGFFDADDKFDLEEFLLPDEQWTYVHVTSDEISQFRVPENRIDGLHIVIHADGSARFSAYGKHTGEEFYTSSFSLHSLIKP